MATVSPSNSLHQQLLDYAHEQVRAHAEEREDSDRGTWLKSKLAFVAAALVGSVTAGWASLVGIARTVEARLFDRGVEEAEDAWERANEALQTVFDGLTGLVDTSSILTGQEIKNIAAINAYGRQIADLHNLSPDLRKSLTDQLKKAQLFVQKGGEGATTEVSNLFKAFDTAKENPVDAEQKLKAMKWTRQ